MSPIERNETYTKWEQDAITMLLLHLCALLICLYLGEMGYAEDTAPVIFVLAVFLTGFFTNGYLWSLLGSLLSVFVVNYFFTEPFSKLSFSGPGYPITFVTLFVVGILTSAMTIRSRDQQRLRAENEKERTRGNLLRAVSHDLRTPLTAISGAINTVLEQQDTLPPEKQRELLRSAEEESEWLIHMVENLLTITRLNGDGETRLITQPEAVEEVMAGAAAKFRRRYPDFAVQVTAPDELLLVPMDATLMEQVLLNLLENAALHGGRVKNITLTARRRNDKASSGWRMTAWGWIATAWKMFLMGCAPRGANQQRPPQYGHRPDGVPYHSKCPWRADHRRQPPAGGRQLLHHAAAGGNRGGRT